MNREHVNFMTSAVEEGSIGDWWRFGSPAPPQFTPDGHLVGETLASTTSCPAHGTQRLSSFEWMWGRYQKDIRIVSKWNQEYGLRL
jgi:hypothetical protein